MKNKIFTIIILGFIYLFMFLSIILPKQEISYAERRKLSSFPTYKMTTEYIDKLERYLIDHFPFRNYFRKIKNSANYNLFQKIESNNTYIADDYIFKSNYPTNDKSITNYISYVNNIKKDLTPENKAYLMVIPDKNYYLNSDKYLNINFEYIYNRLQEEIDINHIDIRSKLSLDNYYKTDTHWKQETLEVVVKELAQNLNFSYQKEYYKTKTYNNFYGVYYSDAKIFQKPETITYLTNDAIENAYVEYLENPSFHKVYNEDKLSKIDSYDVYLDGASSFIEIYNDTCENQKELIVFRDSFASSLIPLLIKYYNKITIIDNRYISSKYYKEKITYTNQDILFLNSTLLVNSSETLKF